MSCFEYVIEIHLRILSLIYLDNMHSFNSSSWKQQHLAHFQQMHFVVTLLTCCGGVDNNRLQLTAHILGVVTKVMHQY